MARGTRKRKSGNVSKPEEPARKPQTVREYHRAHEAEILPNVSSTEDIILSEHMEESLPHELCDIP